MLARYWLPGSGDIGRQVVRAGAGAASFDSSGARPPALQYNGLESRRGRSAAVAWGRDRRGLVEVPIKSK